MGARRPHTSPRRGADVVGVEQPHPATARSSHGQSRVIRQAYFEDPAYVPLLLRAYELWADLERETRAPPDLTGGLMGADRQPRGRRVAPRAREDLPTSARRRRHPPPLPRIPPRPRRVGLYETDAGFVRPERTVAAHVRRPVTTGADLRSRSRRWLEAAGQASASPPRAAPTTPPTRRRPGPWAPRLLADLSVPMRSTAR